MKILPLTVSKPGLCPYTTVCEGATSLLQVKIKLTDGQLLIVHSMKKLAFLN